MTFSAGCMFYSVIILAMFPDDVPCVLFGCVGVVELSVVRITTGSELISDIQTGVVLPVTLPSHSN